MAAGLIPGTTDYGISENPILRLAFPWLNQVVNPAATNANLTPSGQPKLDYTNDARTQIINNANPVQPSGLSAVQDKVSGGGTPPPASSGGSTGPGYSPSFNGQTVSSGGKTFQSSNGQWIEQAQNNAQSAQNATLSAIQDRLNEARRLASQKRDFAKQGFDYLTNKIDTQYPDLMKRSEDRRTAALTDLGTQETNTTNDYERADMQARNRAERTALENRMAARAGNRLGSSFYTDSVNTNKEALSTALGGSDLEKLSKMAAIGARKTETNQYFDETAKDLETAKQDAQQTAYQQYQQAVAEADALDKAGVLDYGSGVQQATDNLNSRLSQIDAYASQIALQQQAYDAAAGKASSSISGFNTSTPTLADALGKTSGINAAQSLTGNVMQVPTSGNAGTQYFGTQKELNLNDILAAIKSGYITQ